MLVPNFMHFFFIYLFYLIFALQILFDGNFVYFYQIKDSLCR